MPDMIGQLERELETAEGQGQGSELLGINIGSEADRGQIAKGIGGTFKSGLQAAQGAIQFEQKQEDAEGEAQKKNQFNELINSGREGIVAYAQEQGLDPTRYGNLANNATDQKGVIGIYKLMQQDVTMQGKAAAKAKIDASIASFGQELSVLEGIEDPKEYAKGINGLVIKAGQLEPEAQKNALALIKTAKSNKALKSGNDLGERKFKAKSGQDKFKNEQSVRKELETKTRDSRKSVEFVDKALNLGKAAIRTKGGKNAASDIALIMAYNKILDEGSVVRESEYDRVEKAQGVFNWIQGLFSSMTSAGGAKLTDDARKRFSISYGKYERT